MKDYTKYYTPTQISKVLVDLLSLENKVNAIDICCGKGNLLAAAHERNPRLKCYGVDVANIEIDLCKIKKEDGRNFALNTKKKFDIVLANPPFGRSENNSYSKLLFVDKYSGMKCKRIEVEMLVANLKILKKGGTLLIIMPTTFVEGISYLKIRKTIAENYYIKSIIDLPLNSFYPESIKCSAIIVENNYNKKNNGCQFFIMNKDFKIEYIKQINYVDILTGFWSGRQCLKTNDFVLKRGSVSSNLFVDKGLAVLHTSKKTESWYPSERYISKKSIQHNYIVANTGDVIISRVGRSAGCMCVYDGCPKYVSDCLFVIKAPSKTLISRLERINLKLLAKGLATPHITAIDIYNLYEQTYKNYSLKENEDEYY